MLDVRRLRLLRELSRLGTIAAVAELLAYTPSAVSQQLAALEREAGVALLERTGRRVTLTPAAHGLVVRTEAILAELERAAADLAVARTTLTGTLRIGAFPTAVRTILPPALVALSRDHPGLELRIGELDPADVPDALRSGVLDIGLLQDYGHAPVAPPDLDSEPLLTETVLLASTDGGDLADHRDSPWIVALPGTLCHDMTMRACEAAGFHPRVRHYTDDFGALLALVAADQGVAFVPDLGTVGAPASVLLRPLPIIRCTATAYRRGSAGRPGIAAARAALLAAARSHAARPPA
ncbi:LysR family transcriptional regulator [Saccharothrix violaceirubra]|uniref:DNA-binding transcriptional LysR family regulator n=1 Tax=Saccharothrix violaceirubra TaxID=413306 RepID=A0A7W7T2Y7_9PSEU|nr:LysR family transcriptional regulator [Saccharothrix violaceirubra]MBB4965556.1 DNA-binding transcriptional LysR family regulator [Saccharothrix violaceirubra]